jgi:hypothetical protein
MAQRSVIPAIECDELRPLIRDLPDLEYAQQIATRNVCARGDPGSTGRGAKKVEGRDDSLLVRLAVKKKPTSQL